MRSVLVALLLLSTVTPASAGRDSVGRRQKRSEAAAPLPERIAVTPGDAANAELHAAFEDWWQALMEDEPVWASELGDRRYDDHWPDRSLASYASRDARDRAALERVKAVDGARLPAEDRIHRDLFTRMLSEDLEERRFKMHLLAVSPRGGVQTANELWESLPFATVGDYEAWIARLRGVGEHVRQVEALLREGVRTGMTQPRIVMGRVPDQIAHQVVTEPSQSPFYKPFEKMPESIGAEEQARLRREGQDAIRTVVVPAYAAFGKFFDQTYLPATREEVGASALPNGDEIYAFRVRQFTTTTLTPREVHDLGLSEVARIRREMERVKEQAEFRGSFKEFVHFLRTDSRFHVDDPQRLLEIYRATSKKADPELCKLFGRLPRAPYGVRPIPDEIAPDTTTAYYNGPAADGTRAGTYYVNLHAPESRPLYEVEALSLHEAVPGHHLQIALAQELGEMPAFRRHTGPTAFIEGWGLYAESLGEEMGFYEDPYSKFGQLTYEAWRAVRLVVDTGIHAFGWDRQRAIDYMLENTAKAELDVINEIDRYISWPGQAVAYKVGELRIKELRRRATAELGGAFDVRGFHDVVLGSGAVPLDVLERNVDDWIREKRR